MAFCTECGAEMDATAVRCDACGYEFPDIGEIDLVRERFHIGWAYSPAADLVLLVAQILLGITVVITLIGVVGTAITAASYPSWHGLQAFISMTSACLLSAAALIAFVRIGNL